jgi:hypothetical protein
MYLHNKKIYVSIFIMEISQEYIYRNTTDFIDSDRLYVCLSPHESTGVEIKNKDGSASLLDKNVKGLRFSLSPDEYPRLGWCYKVSVQWLRENNFLLLEEYGSDSRSVFVVFPNENAIRVQKYDEIDPFYNT